MLSISNHLLWLITTAEATPAAASPLGALGPLPMFAIIFFIFYFLMIRPQQKRMKQHQAMINEIRPGDEVLTSGGIYGKIFAVQDDDIRLEVADKVRVRIARANIAQVFQDTEKEKA